MKSSITDSTRLMTVDEIAGILHYSPKTVYKKAAKGEIPSVPISRRKRLFSREAINYLARQSADGKARITLVWPNPSCWLSGDGVKWHSGWRDEKWGLSLKGYPLGATRHSRSTTREDGGLKPRRLRRASCIHGKDIRQALDAFLKSRGRQDRHTLPEPPSFGDFNCALSFDDG